MVFSVVAVIRREASGMTFASRSADTPHLTEVGSVVATPLIAARSAARAGFDRATERGGGFRQPMPERGRKASRDREFVGRRGVDLPQVDADMDNAGHRGIPGPKRARMEIDHHPLGQCVPYARAADAHDEERIRLGGGGDKEAIAGEPAGWRSC